MTHFPPCPKCDGRLSLMAGCNLRRVATDRDYLVCWACMVGRDFEGTEWGAIAEPLKPEAGRWTVHSRTHWTRLIGDEELHYWPTTGSVRFMGVTTRNVFDIDKFIEGIVDG